MSRNETETDRKKERTDASAFAGMGCCADSGGRWGSCGNMGEMMQNSPCAGWFSRHRLAVYTAMTLFGLGLLLVPAGWVLGVIAFFRTI